MSEYRTQLVWQRRTPDFSYGTYERTHSMSFGAGGAQLALSAAPEYKGDPSLANPEELLVAALSSCHMLSFLAIAARKRLVVDGYEDSAVGTMAKNEAGKLFVAQVTLRPRVRFAETPAPEVIAQLHHEAHVECFIANSVLTQVTVLPQL